MGKGLIREQQIISFFVRGECCDILPPPASHRGNCVLTSTWIGSQSRAPFAMYRRFGRFPANKCIENTDVSASIEGDILLPHLRTLAAGLVDVWPTHLYLGLYSFCPSRARRVSTSFHRGYGYDPRNIRGEELETIIGERVSTGWPQGSGLSLAAAWPM